MLLIYSHIYRNSHFIITNVSILVTSLLELQVCTGFDMNSTHIFPLPIHLLMFRSPTYCALMYSSISNSVLVAEMHFFFLCRIFQLRTLYLPIGTNSNRAFRTPSDCTSRCYAFLPAQTNAWTLCVHSSSRGI